MSSYHDLHITTERIDRISLFDLPFRVEVTCSRGGGWEVWARADREGNREELLGSEYGPGMRLDVAGHVICDSLTKAK